MMTGEYLMLYFRYIFHRKMRLARDIELIAEIAEAKCFMQEAHELYSMVKRLKEEAYEEVYR
jgi:hypothetical protein